VPSPCIPEDRVTNATPSPLLLQPRLDPKPWGGRALARFGLLPSGNGAIGEALATAPEAVVAAGPLAGRSLGEVVAADPVGILGERGLAVTGGRPLFPLLIKLIDAADVLSVQVHPDDATAAPLGRLGKTETWHILAAAPGASLFLGLRPDVGFDGFATACREDRGTAGACLRRVPAMAGSTVLIPAGTVHALGAGVLVYELQQPSDITYRLDDWGRVDAAGNPRQLHVEDGLAAIDAALRPEPIAPLRLATGAGRRQLLAACRLFALERIALAAGETVPLRAAGSPQTVTCLRGEAALETEASTPSVAVRPGETAVVPAALSPAELRANAPSVLLRAWVPNLLADIVRPALAAGHDPEAIARLAGPLPDLRQAHAE